MALSYGYTMLTASVFASAVLLLRLPLRKRLPARFFDLAWTAAILLFLLPFRLPSPISVYSVVGNAALPQLLSAPTEIISGMASAGSAAPAFPVAQTLKTVAAAGSIAFAAFFAGLWIYWGLRLRRSGLRRRRDIEALARCRFRRVRVYVSQRVRAPCMRGSLFVSIYFPSGWTLDGGDETKMALYHELGHAAHFDDLKKLALSLILCLQWYNPVSWLMYFYAQRDMELSSDSYVLSRLGTDVRARYARLLVSAGGSPPAPLSSLGKGAVKERIVWIMTSKKPSRKTCVAAAVGLVLALLVFASGFSFTDTPWLYVDLMPQERVDCNAVGSDYQSERLEYDGRPLRLANGSYLTLSAPADAAGQTEAVFSLTPVEGCNYGQPVQYGYLLDGEYVSLGSLPLLDGTALRVDNADLNGGALYIRSAAVDSIYVRSIEVTAA